MFCNSNLLFCLKLLVYDTSFFYKYKLSKNNKKILTNKNNKNILSSRRRENIMKINTEQAGKILKRIIKIAFLVAIPIIIILPFIIKGENNIIFYMSIIYPNSILMLGIMYQFVRLFSSLEKNNPFTIENVNILSTTSKISYSMSLLWIIDLFILLFGIKNNDLNYIIVIIFLSILFFGVGVALWLLSVLFEKATNYKEENELTI